MPKNIFDKPSLSIKNQVTLLQERGLIINDIPLSENFLRYIGYYHLSAYMLPFQKADQTNKHHQFIDGTTFEDILDAYTFDRKLRLLVMDAIERIEISLRAVIINEMCNAYDSHWYTNPEYFEPNFDHKTFIKRLQKDIQYQEPIRNVRNLCIQHYYQTYDHPEMPPAWISFEALSFSTMSIIFKNINFSDRKRIASSFNLPPSILSSWLHSLSYTRNICAHHQRLWNRILTIKPIIPRDKSLSDIKEEMTTNTKFYAQALTIRKILEIISPETKWQENLFKLVQEHPNLKTSKMGFTENWFNSPFWKNYT